MKQKITRSIIAYFMFYISTSVAWGKSLNIWILFIILDKVINIAFNIILIFPKPPNKSAFNKNSNMFLLIKYTF